MNLDEVVLIVWIALSGLIAIPFCSWMAVDLWLDLQALRSKHLNGLAAIQTKAAIRLEIISVIASVALLIVGIMSAWFTWGPQDALLTRWLTAHRMVLSRILIVTVIAAIPGRSIWDRIDRVRSGWKIRDGKVKSSDYDARSPRLDQ